MLHNVMDTQTLQEVEQLREAFRKKKKLEKIIVDLIRQFEDETGLAVDLINYERDITLPISNPHYTRLTIKMTSEELNVKPQ